MDVQCDFCPQDVPPVGSPGTTGIVSLDLYDSPNWADWSERANDRICGDCLIEVEELASDMDAVDGLRLPQSEEAPNLGDYHDCGFCGDGISGNRGVLIVNNNGLESEYVVCERCTEVIHSFLQNVPET